MTKSIMQHERSRQNVDGRTAARNGMLLNVLVLPGMGSLMGGRIASGLGQLALAAAGFVLVMVWFAGLMVRYYGLMFGDGQSGFNPPSWTGTVGAIMFVVAWLWALATGLGLMRAASREAERASFQREPKQNAGLSE